MGGLQPPYLGQTCSFTTETGKYIQVVHNGADHWLVVTNIGVPRDGVVRVYDSLYKCLTTSTELQIASIVNTSQPKISIEFVDVQKQWLWCICNCICYSPLSGSGSRYSSLLSMRRHLFKMLKEKKLTMFPVLKKKRSVRVTEGNPILVYCNCRMPEVGDMIECSNCEEWFHIPSCSSPTQAALNDTTSFWFCNKCNN